MKDSNKDKMKAILDELEDEFVEEKKENEIDNEKVIEDKTENDKEDDEVVKEMEDDETVSIDVDKEKNDLTDDKKEEDVLITDEENEVKEQEDKDELLEKCEIKVKESPISKVGHYLIEKLQKYKFIIILDLVIFLFLFFLIPTIILEVKPVIWMTLFLIFTIIPTVAFYLGKLFKKVQILFSLPFFYLCIFIVLDSCTIKDLYGITSHGGLDRTPAWVDAILVTFIIVFFQYIGLTAIDFARKLLNKRKKKEN